MLRVRDSTSALLGGVPVRSKGFPKHTTMLDAAERQLVLEVLEDGELSGFSGRVGSRFLGGPRVRQLEADACTYFGTRFAISFNSATSALHGVISACGIGPGDEVITSPFSMSATASCVLMSNAVPVFADIDAQTYCLDPESVTRLLTPRTKAILTVNLFGHPSALRELREIARRHGIRLLEDNAQAASAMCDGQRAGTWGDAGVLSLNYHKVIQCGEGGLVITDDAELAVGCQLIRNHGEMVAPEIGRAETDNQLGWNYRLTELAAAVAIPQLAKLDRLIEIRRELAERLSDALHPFDSLTPAHVMPGCTHTYYLYAFQFDAATAGMSRDTFARALAAEGMPVAEGYMRPLYLLPLYQQRRAYTRGCPFTCGHYDGQVSYAPGICPVAEDMYERRLLITDMCKYPNTMADVDEFALAVGKVLDNRVALRSAGYE